jgi:predicted ArsR family transcriptional regulator
VRLGISQTEAARHLEDFESLGLLARDSSRPAPKPKGGRPATAYCRNSDHFWSCLEELGERFRREPPTATAKRVQRPS